MCLNTGFFSRKHTAKTDIVVYKYLIQPYSGSTEYFLTPYQFSVVHLGNTYESRLRRDILFQVDYGLHSFVNYDECLDEAGSFWNFRASECLAIVKCVIPKGSRFYIGKYGSTDSIASDKLIYEKIMKFI